MVDFLDPKKRKFIEDEFAKLKHKFDLDEDITDEEFLHKKEKERNLINNIDISDIADINPDSDLPITEKKTKEERFLK